MEEVKKKKTYRNFKRSEDAIIRAYVELINSGKKITVTDIVSRADLNRSTFYAHFKTVDEVGEKIQSDIINELLGSFNEHDYRNLLDNPHSAMMHVAEFLKRDEKMYKTLLNTNKSNQFLRKMRDIIIDQFMSDRVVLPNIKDKDGLETNLRMFIGGYVSVIQDWALGDISISLDKCSKIMGDSIKLFVEKNMSENK